MGKFKCNDCSRKCVLKVKYSYSPPDYCPLIGDSVYFIPIKSIFEFTMILLSKLKTQPKV